MLFLAVCGQRRPVVLAARNAHRAFDCAAEAWVIDTKNPQVLGIGRYFRGEKVLCLFNFSDGDVTVTLDDAAEYADLLTGEVRSVETVTVPAQGFFWLKKN